MSCICAMVVAWFVVAIVAVIVVRWVFVLFAAFRESGIPTRRTE